MQVGTWSFKLEKGNSRDNLSQYYWIEFGRNQIELIVELRYSIINFFSLPISRIFEISFFKNEMMTRFFLSSTVLQLIKYSVNDNVKIVSLRNRYNRKEDASLGMMNN